MPIDVYKLPQIGCHERRKIMYNLKSKYLKEHFPAHKTGLLMGVHMAI